MNKRGLTYAESLAYVGVKRRTFDERWRPRLVAIKQGSCLIFDRGDLDRLFDRFKAEAAGDNNNDQAANDAGTDPAQNAPRNGRPANLKGEKQWAKELQASTPATTVPGKLTSGGAGIDFASAVSLVTNRQKAG